MDTPNTQPTPSVVANTGALAKAQEKAVTPVPVVSADLIPCNWSFSWDDDLLMARNIITGREFKGSKEEFRELIRG